MLVEGGAGGGEGAGGVGQDPVHLLSHPSIDTGEAFESTSTSPADNSNKSLAAVLGGNHGTARISLAGVLSGVSSADHVGGDTAISVVALSVGGHCDVDLLQDSGLAAPAAEGSPSGDGGQDSGECVAQVGWKACRAHFVGEGDRVCQTKDGIVVVSCLWVIVGVVDDLGDIDPVEVAVGDVVLSKDHPDAGCIRLSAMGSGEDVGGRDEGSSAPGGASIPAH